jgi:cytochrome c-type biogenesis protein CcmH
MMEMLLALVLANPAVLTSRQTEQIHKVEGRLLAPCCYTQSIAVHGSDIAAQMRSEVAGMVADGKSEEEIVNHYRAIYGERILIVPDGVTGRILFSLPLLTAALGGLILLVWFRKMLRSGRGPRATSVHSPGQTAQVDDALRAKIAREIGDLW